MTRRVLTEGEARSVAADITGSSDRIIKALSSYLKSIPGQTRETYLYSLQLLTDMIKSGKKVGKFIRKNLMPIFTIIAGVVGVVVSTLIITISAGIPALLAALATVISLFLASYGGAHLDTTTESYKMKKNKLTEDQKQEIVAQLNDPNFRQRCAEAIAAKIQSLPKAEAEALLEEIKAFIRKWGVQTESILSEGAFRYIKAAFIIIAGMIGISITAFLAMWSASIAGFAAAVVAVMVIAVKTVEGAMGAMGAFDRRTESAAVQIANTKRKLEEALSSKKKLTKGG